MSNSQDLPVNPMFRVISRCWQDAVFAAKLRDDPKSALAEYGIDIPENVSVNVSQDTEDTLHIVIPLPPTEDELKITSDGIMLASSTVSVCRPCSCFFPSNV
jgi:Nitrile hydratase, alpha chain